MCRPLVLTVILLFAVTAHAGDQRKILRFNVAIQPLLPASDRWFEIEPLRIGVFPFTGADAMSFLDAAASLKAFAS